MSTFEFILGAILFVAAAFLIVAILIQQGKSKGMSGAVGGGTADTFFGKTKGKSRDKKLAKLTTIVSIVFVLIVIFVYVIQSDSSQDFWNENKDNIPEETTTEETEAETPKETTGSETTASETTGETTAPATNA